MLDIFPAYTLNWQTVHQSRSDFISSYLKWNPSSDVEFVCCFSPFWRWNCANNRCLFASDVHLVGLHGQKHCQRTNWPHWSDTECFVSFVFQVPTCSSQNKLSCNVTGQKNLEGACCCAPLKGNKCSIREIFCRFGHHPGVDTSSMVGNLKPAAWSSAAPAGVTAGGITHKTWNFSALRKPFICFWSDFT